MLDKAQALLLAASAGLLHRRQVLVVLRQERPSLALVGPLVWSLAPVEQKQAPATHRAALVAQLQ